MRGIACVMTPCLIAHVEVFWKKYQWSPEQMSGVLLARRVSIDISGQIKARWNADFHLRQRRKNAISAWLRRRDVA